MPPCTLRDSYETSEIRVIFNVSKGYRPTNLKTGLRAYVASWHGRAAGVLVRPQFLSFKKIRSGIVFHIHEN